MEHVSSVAMAAALVLLAGWMVWLHRRVGMALGRGKEAKEWAVTAHGRCDAHSRALRWLAADVRNGVEAVLRDE
jgi:hypothetical protein